MAVMAAGEDKVSFTLDDWYVTRRIDERTGALNSFTLTKQANDFLRRYDSWKTEMKARVGNFDKLERLADGQVVSKKPDLPNISSGETAGIVRRIARNLVQNAPNVEVVCKFDDDSVEGIFARHILTSRIIRSDEYSNDMQQNLFASTKSAFTLGFDCVIPVLMKDAGGGWFVKYDSIHYRDVFPEPGAKDVRDANAVYIRRYLTESDVKRLIRTHASGWDEAALQALLQRTAPERQMESASLQDKKSGRIPEGHPVITWYSNTGKPFLTFHETSGLLLRVERNKHPLKEHPVHFLVLEKDAQQPLGKSQVELLYGRQEFQDLMLNGSMKLWYRNINPAIIAYGAPNATPNLGPGKYTNISNPNARVEAFAVENQTLMMYGTITQQNLTSMVQLVGAADQQMATQGGDVSLTPQGVEQQQAMVDITTNNYQKAIESFISRYCSYALTTYFAELKALDSVVPTAEARQRLLRAGMREDQFDRDGALVNISYERLAVEYFVRTVPGSLVEMEDEKQLRILNQLFVPLSQAMPALAQIEDKTALQNATATMQYIMQREIELSGSSSAKQLKELLTSGQTSTFEADQAKVDRVEAEMAAMGREMMRGMQAMMSTLGELQNQVKELSGTQDYIVREGGAPSENSGENEGIPSAPQEAIPQ